MPEAKLTMTKADEFALSKCPDGWFEYHDLPYMVRCPEFRLERLQARGQVEVQYKGTWPNSVKKYRKVQQ